MNKPRLAEILGVEVGETFRVGDYKQLFWIRDDGIPTAKPYDICVTMQAIVQAINHPESMHRTSKLPECIKELCRSVGAKWVTRTDPRLNITEIQQMGSTAFSIELWHHEPVLDEKTGFYHTFSAIAIPAVSIYGKDVFPQIKPGACIDVDEAE